MSALWERLKRPEIYLAALAATIAVLGADTLREPQKQWTARAYVSAIHLYQQRLSARLGARVKCRFEPTCSHYSEEAIKRYGIGRGLKMTASRLWRCRNDVTPGTRDPVPQSVRTADASGE